MKTKIPLPQAQSIAEEVVELLRPACERVEIAGSIRRRKDEVGDIEIVCIPLKQENLFGYPGASLLTPHLDSLVRRGLIFPGGKCGEKFKQYTYRAFDGPQIDLFIVTPETWGCIFTIRTGSANFTKRLVLDRQHNGLCPSHLRFRKGRIWDGNEALETPEETDVFNALGLDWIEPRKRD